MRFSVLFKYPNACQLNMIQWLLGEIKSLPDNGLPSNGDVMRAYYYHHLVLGNLKRCSVIKLTKKVMEKWKAEQKNTSEQRNIVRKITTLVRKYEGLKKSKSKRSKTQANKQKAWKNMLKDCFDISAKSKIVAKPQFKKVVKERQQRGKNVKCNMVEADFFSDGSDVISDDMIADTNDYDYDYDLTHYQKNKLSIPLIDKSNCNILSNILNSPDVSSALDRTKTSSGTFTIISAAMARACKQDLSESPLSVSTVRRRRIKHRNVIDTQVQNEFSEAIKLKPPLVVHFDGKRLEDVTNPETAFTDTLVERIAIVVNGLNVQKIIGIPKADNGTGLVVSDTVFENLMNWDVADNIIGICTDTTSSNTGHLEGACVKLERKLKRNLLYFACNHHVREVVIGGVYRLLFGPTKGPKVQLFQKFKADWKNIKNKRKIQALDFNLFKKNAYARELRNEVIVFIRHMLSRPRGDKCFPRGDYRELLELTLLILGESIPGYVIKKPGACHNARWMAHIIYAMKIYLFRGAFGLSRKQQTDLKAFCLFASLVYVKSWIECPITSNAPKNSLEFYKLLHSYSSLNKKISERALLKFQNHLWYLGEEMIFLSLFSDHVHDDEKRQIIKRMLLTEGAWIKREVRLTNYCDLHKKELCDLVGSASLPALKSLRLNIQFMFDEDPRVWNTLPDYQYAKKNVDSFKVVNDVAEGALALMTEVNGKLTKNERDLQRLIQVTEDNRKRIPTKLKYVLSTYKRR